MEPHNSRLTIQLLVFSGRTDPSWTASPEVEEEIERRVQQNYTAGNAAERPPNRLGYGGFLLHGPDSRQPKKQRRVFAGKIWDPSDPDSTRLDVAGLEGMLLERAKMQGHVRLLKRFGAPEQEG